MIHAVIFDVDGTLVDSVDLHTRAWREAFAHFGFDLRYDDIRSQIGKGGDQIIPAFVPPAQVGNTMTFDLSALSVPKVR